MERVVITGMGALTPLGNTPQQFYRELLEGRTGIRAHPDCDLPHPVGAVDFEPTEHFSKMELLGLDRVSQLAIVAAQQAMGMAGVDLSDPAIGERMGVFWGTGAGGADSTEQAYAKFFDAGGERKKLLTVPAAMFHASASQVAMRFQVRGECQTYSTACSSAAVAIGEGFRRVQQGVWPSVLVGGADCMLLPGVIDSWCAMRVLCQDPADAPGTGCRPFSVDRSGFAIGEGAAAFVLESLTSAAARGATPLAEIVGYGVSNDATHITKPDPGGQARAMQAALTSARLSPSDVHYINAHGTATRAGDAAEIDSIRRVFGDYAKRIPVSSTKSAHGHLMGATGAVEFVASIHALRDRTVPPTTHFTSPDEGVDLDFVPHYGRDAKSLRTVMSNSFAFGGNNAVLIARAI